jgi:hypothetical protein
MIEIDEIRGNGVMAEAVGLNHFKTEREVRLTSWRVSICTSRMYTETNISRLHFTD